MAGHASTTPNDVLAGLAPERASARRQLVADLLALAGCLVLFSLLALWLAPFMPDDAFITFRYADHLAHGHGLRFNVDEPPVEAYSNFLWLATLAGAARLGLGLEPASVWLGGLFGSLNVVLLWWLLRRRGHRGLLLAAPVALLAVAAPLLLYAVSGLETALFACLLLALLLGLDELLARPTLARGAALAGLGALAALARPEGVVAFPVLVVCALLFAPPERRRPLAQALGRGGLLFLTLLALYHGARVAYFDAVWPTPFLSKGMTGGSLIDGWLVNLRQFFLRQSNYYAPLVYYYIALGLPAAVAAALAFRRGQRRPLEYSALILAFVYAALYFNFADWMPGMRYHAPLIGPLLVAFSLLGPELHERMGTDARGGQLPYLLLAGTLVLFSLSSLAVLRLDSQQLQDGTQESLVALGLWLRENAPAGATLAMSDVGATPYYSGLRTIDINPDSLTDRHIAERGWSSDYFFAADPEVVVLTAFSLSEPDFYPQHEALYALPEFQAAYERVGVVRNDWYQDRSYWVFMRRDATPTAARMATFPRGISKQ